MLTPSRSTPNGSGFNARPAEEERLPAAAPPVNALTAPLAPSLPPKTDRAERRAWRKRRLKRYAGAGS